MGWRGFVKRPSWTLAGLATCVGLLANFQGAMTTLASISVFLKGIIPPLAVGASAFFAWSFLALLVVDSPGRALQDPASTDHGSKGCHSRFYRQTEQTQVFTLPFGSFAYGYANSVLNRRPLAWMKLRTK